MTAQEKRIVTTFAVAWLSYVAWCAFVIWFTSRGFTFAVHTMVTSDRIKSWILSTQISPTVIVATAAVVWLGVIVFMWWLPIWILKKRGPFRDAA